MSLSRFEIYTNTDLDSVAECMAQSFTKKQIANWICENLAERLDNPYKFLTLLKKEIKKWDIEEKE